MNAMRAVLGGLVLAGAAVVAVPGPAHACSCATADARQYLTWADAVAFAEVREARVPDDGDGLAHYLLDVETVYKGEVTERTVLRSEASGAACGLEGIGVGERHVFFLERAVDGHWTSRFWGAPEGQWTANLCGGTGLVPPQRMAQLVGTTQTPAQDEAEPSTSKGPARTGVPEPGGPERLPLSAYSYAGMGVGALAAVVVAAVLWLRRGAR